LKVHHLYGKLDAEERPLKKTLISFCLFVFVALTTAPAQAPDGYPRRNNNQPLPSFLLSGFDAYKTKGAEEAIHLWIKDGPLEGNKEAISQVSALRQIEELYGAYQGYETVFVRELSFRTQVIYLILDYENGPLFGRFTIYRTNHRWVLTSFDFSLKEENTFPPPQ
jgi:hypothetical protein